LFLAGLFRSRFGSCVLPLPSTQLDQDFYCLVYEFINSYSYLHSSFCCLCACLFSLTLNDCYLLSSFSWITLIIFIGICCCTEWFGDSGHAVVFYKRY